MKNVLMLTLAVGGGMLLGQLSDSSPQVEAGGGAALPPCQDINGDGASDTSDAIYLLQWLFLGGSAPVCTNPEQPVRGLPDSGQTNCYSEVEGQGWIAVPCEQAPCKGQDVSYETGCSPEDRFVDPGDGTVIDECTGLMWEKLQAEDGAGALRLPRWYNWCNALQYCEDLTLAGHDDWRPPNVRELQSIVDYGRVAPAMDPILGGETNVYWTSTSGVADPTLGWFVDFSDGRVDCVGPRPDPYSVRAVRTVR